MESQTKNSSRIKIGQVFRVPYRGRPANDSEFVSYQALTRGAHAKSADLQKSMFFYQQLREPNQSFSRLPAFIFHSNPFKTGAEATPWVDVVEPDAGYCLFHGDNRKPGSDPLASRGNAKFVQVQDFYADPGLRKFAPPVLVFEQVEYNDSSRGYRRFCGFGVPVRRALATQKQKKGGYFTNLVIELALFRLEQENEYFDWNWIDLRRDGAIGADDALAAAPRSWKEWVVGGELAIDGCRRIVAHQTVVDLSEQRPTSKEEQEILSEVLRYYVEKKHAFEGLASFIAQKILGNQCRRGWGDSAIGGRRRRLCLSAGCGRPRRSAEFSPHSCSRPSEVYCCRRFHRWSRPGTGSRSFAARLDWSFCHDRHLLSGGPTRTGPRQVSDCLGQRTATCASPVRGPNSGEARLAVLVG